jgi:hybrid polyketide synthase/nonribosomal peptide synthetase FtdB
MPNSEAQEQLLRSVYARAGVSPVDLDYIEAHGTGTQQGDYAEAMALDRVLREREEPCLIGSVKTNIGHLEAAAGVAGLIKAALCMYHGEVPPNLHFLTPNTKLNFSTMKIEVASERASLDPDKEYYYAGVNSFGYGGTIAHALLRSPRHDLTAGGSCASRISTAPLLLPFSARDENALRQSITAHARMLVSDHFVGEDELRDVMHTLALRRTHHDARAVVVGESGDSVIAALSAFIEQSGDERIIQGKVPALECRLNFAYSGIGPQWWGMGQSLVRGSTVFSEFLDRCDSIFVPLAGWSLREEFLTTETASRINRADVAQPLNFVLQAGVTAVLASLGIRPDCVVGHSVGEVTAGYVSGALTLEDALLVSYHRSRLQQRCAGHGGLMAAHVPVGDVAAFTARFPDLCVSAVNSPRSITLAGQMASLEAVSMELTAREIFNRILRVDIAYHSTFMEPIRAEILSSLASLRGRSTAIKLVSTVTGVEIRGEDLTADYWWRNVREPVLFTRAIDTMLERDHYNVFVEIGPHPVLNTYLDAKFAETGVSGRAVTSLSRGTSEVLAVHRLASELYTLGITIDWTTLLDKHHRQVDLPKYQWQRERCWMEADNTRAQRHLESDFVFVGNRRSCPRPSWEIEWNDQFFPYTFDHILSGSRVFPGAAFVEAGLQVAREFLGAESISLSGITFEKLCVLDTKRHRKIVTEISPDDQRFEVWSEEAGTDGKATWTRHATGAFAQGRESSWAPSLGAFRESCPSAVDIGFAYAQFERLGLNYGPNFRGLRALHYSDRNRAYAHVVAGPDGADKGAYLIHPTVLDSAFQSLIALDDDFWERLPYIPLHLGEITLHSAVGSEVFVCTEVIEKDEKRIKANLALFDVGGNLVCTVVGFECHRLTAGEDSEQTLMLADRLYRPLWKPVDIQPSDAGAMPSTVLISAAADASTRAIEREMMRVNPNATVIRSDDLRYFAADGRLLDEAKVIARHSAAHDSAVVVYVLPSPKSDRLDTTGFQALTATCQQITQLALTFNSLTSTRKKLILVTHDAHIVEPSDAGAGVMHSALNGLTFLIQNELVPMRAKSIDIPSRRSRSVTERLVAECLSDNIDADVALREERRFVLELTHTQPFSAEVVRGCVDPAGTYLITGGTSGFGLELAKWLARKGAKRIVLVSRRGLVTPHALHTAKNLAKHGVAVVVRTLDIADCMSVSELIRDICSGSWPLRGVFHCAMQLDDALLSRLDRDKYERVLNPKILGTIHLHNATRDLPLDYFVMASSISSMIGNVAQANYVVGNSFLDFFAAYRRARNLPATTLNIGVLGDVGVIARRSELTQYLEILSINKNSAHDVIQLLDAMVVKNVSHAGVFDFDWLKWANGAPRAAESSRFAPILKRKLAEQNQTKQISKHFKILTTVKNAPAEVGQLIADEVRACVATTLRRPAETIDENEPIHHMGVDSLLVAELRHRIITQLDVEVSLVELFGAHSTRTLSELIQRKFETLIESRCSPDLDVSLTVGRRE